MQQIAFFTCARPGRSKDPASKKASVADHVVDKWVATLSPGTRTAIVSLLGRKPGGMSEFDFYTFHGKDDTPQERGSRPSFQQWLDRRHPARAIRVVEHPTTDLRPVAAETLRAAEADIEALLASGWTVVLMDSGGETRTKALCRHMKFVEDSRKL